MFPLSGGILRAILSEVGGNLRLDKTGHSDYGSDNGPHLLFLTTVQYNEQHLPLTTVRPCNGHVGSYGVYWYRNTVIISARSRHYTAIFDNITKIPIDLGLFGGHIVQSDLLLKDSEVLFCKRRCIAIISSGSCPKTL